MGDAKIPSVTTRQCYTLESAENIAPITHGPNSLASACGQGACGPAPHGPPDLARPLQPGSPCLLNWEDKPETEDVATNSRPVTATARRPHEPRLEEPAAAATDPEDTA